MAFDETQLDKMWRWYQRMQSAEGEPAPQGVSPFASNVLSAAMAQRQPTGLAAPGGTARPTGAGAVTDVIGRNIVSPLVNLAFRRAASDGGQVSPPLPPVTSIVGSAGGAGALGALASGYGPEGQLALPTAADIIAGSTLPAVGAEGGSLISGGAEAAGSSLGSLAGAIQPWLGPLSIAAGIGTALATSGEDFNATKDTVRSAMASMGPDEAARRILAQADGQVTWSSQSSATSPLQLLDSFGDVFGQDHPLFALIEENLYRRTVPPGARDITEADIPGILGDARSIGVLPARGQQLGYWRSHPNRPYRYWFYEPRTPEERAERIAAFEESEARRWNIPGGGDA